MKLIKIAILTAIIPTLFNQCTKHTPEPPGFTCPVGLDSLTVAAVNVDTLLSCAVLPCAWQCEQSNPPAVRYLYSFPCFNPNNQDEIAFIRFDYQGVFGDNVELCVLDMCTGVQKIIHNKVLTNLDWSVKDWILFTGRNQMLYKIKPNGDSLTQMSFSGDYNFNAVWNPDGSRFVWFQQVGSLGLRIVSDEFGINQDTLPITVNAGRFEWITNSKIAFDYGVTGQPSARVGIIDIGSYETQYDVFNLEGLGFYPNTYLLNMDWIESEQSVLFSTKLGVFKTNIHTKQRTVLVNGFDETRRYEWARVSPDGKFCLMHRRDGKSTVCKTDFMERLYVVNLDGTNERRVKLAE
ncbi:MAG: TolB family protein [Saprospiraceae bacterium]